jgi:phosphopantothenoylcysteine decarboxylase/phosphopantothenate--cysteine ligase
LVVNDISRDDIGFAANDNEVYIVSKNGDIKKINKSSKKEIAKKIVELL